jgi:hypothetical protein
MTDTAPNDGVIITGGTVSGQVNNRSHGTFVQGSPAPSAAPGEDALGRLAELERLLDEHKDRISEYPKARRDVSDLRDEMTRPEPDRDSDRITDTLGRLTKRVGAIAVLATAVDKLGHIIRGML